MSKTILAQVDGFTPVIDTVVQDVGILGAVVFGKVWRYCQMEDGVCKASQQRIANELSITRKTVNDHINQLITAGYLRDLTPTLSGLPHVYADTGKAGLSLSLSASPQPVTESYRGSNQKLQPPVTESYTKKESKKEKKEREIIDPVAEKLLEIKIRFNANTGTIIQGWKDWFTDDVILRAIDDAVNHGGNSIEYIDRVISGWHVRGVPATKEERATTYKKNPYIPQPSASREYIV